MTCKWAYRRLIIRIRLVIPAKEELSLGSKKAFYFSGSVLDSSSEVDSQGSWLFHLSALRASGFS